ncbi:MAG TPA: type II secretion system F family protein [Acidobacteriaceae bacterium]|nr:type II secretion system F family protein [Acidobacteriaceae bacterium]
MGLATFSFIVIFALIASAGMLLFYREAMLQRLSDVVNPRPKRTDLLGTIQQTGTSIGGIVGSFDRVVPKSAAEKSIVEKRLVRAGYRNENAVKVFYGAKVIVPLVLCLVAIVTGVASYSPFFAYAASLGIGFILPDFWLGRRIKIRQKKIRKGLPDALDFMVICIEAGLGIDQATTRTAEELALAHPAVSDELDVLVLEQRAGRPRADAWRGFAERTDVDTVRVLTTVLIQAEQLGTSISKTLRVHSESLRTQRRQQIEEQAAKTSVKLVFPLVFFIFPSLFLVTLGPEAIIMSEAFKTYFPH